MHSTEMLEEMKAMNVKLDKIIEAFKSWQAQDEHYHKKSLEGNHVRKG